MDLLGLSRAALGEGRQQGRRAHQVLQILLLNLNPVSSLLTTPSGKFDANRSLQKLTMSGALTEG